MGIQNIMSEHGFAFISKPRSNFGAKNAFPPQKKKKELKSQRAGSQCIKKKTRNILMTTH